MQHTNPKVEKEKNLEFTRKSALDQHHNNSSQMLFFSKENKLILLNEKNLQKLNNVEDRSSTANQRKLNYLLIQEF